MPAIRHVYNGITPLLRAVPDRDDKLPRIDVISGTPICMHWMGFLSVSDPKPRPGKLVSILAAYSTPGDGWPTQHEEWRRLQNDERVLGWAVQLRPKVYGVYGLNAADGWPVIVGGLNPDPYFKPKAGVIKFPCRGGAV